VFDTSGLSLLLGGDIVFDTSGLSLLLGGDLDVEGVSTLEFEFSFLRGDLVLDVSVSVLLVGDLVFGGTSLISISMSKFLMTPIPLILPSRIIIRIPAFKYSGL